MRVALDVMGTDRGPGEIVVGAVMAAEAGFEVVLVGDENDIRPMLRQTGADLDIVHAPDVIEMHEDPTRALRKKPDSSVVTAARLVRSGEAEAMVSAGSTGAAMAAATILIGRISGVLRPAIATIIPTSDHPVTLIDAGANTDVRPQHLAQFAVMGSLVAEIICGIESPRIGLLNIGKERAKGRELDRSAYGLLEAAAVNFVGNVEGSDIVGDVADVFVTDGFTGNVALKTLEGTAIFAVAMVQAALARLPLHELPGVEGAVADVEETLNSEQYGGAHLVGTRGGVVIGHGSSSRVAIFNAVRVAIGGVKGGLVERLEQEFGSS